MELLYIWIDNFANIKGQEFNLNGKYHFKLVDKQINIHPVNPELPDNFWNHKKIINVSGIIGENGAGKTSLLNYLYTYLNNFRLKAIYIVYDKNEKKYKLFSHKSLGKITFNLENFPNFQKEEIQYDLNTHDKFQINKIPIIYFSNALSVRKLRIGSNTYDISTTGLLEDIKVNSPGLHFTKLAQLKDLTNELRKSPLLHQIHHKELKELQKLVSEIPELWTRDPFETFRLAEFKKQINFLDQKPENIKLEFESRLDEIDGYFGSSNDITYISRANIKLSYFPFVRNYFQKENKAPEGWISLTNIDIFRYLICICYVPIIDKIYGEANKQLSENYLLNLLAASGIEQQNFFKSKVDNFINHIKQLGDSNDIYAFFDYLENRLRDNEISLTVREYATEYDLDVLDFQFKISRKSLLNFIHFYENSFGGDPIIKFHWNISSGENALLNIYSRFFSIKETIKSEGDVIWILIDEGELYMHPQWQKEFLDNFLKFIPKCFPGKHLQLIFTSHSPFLTSDIPKSNLSFLRIIKENRQTEVSDQVSEQTFGGNIFSLYRNSFYVGGGLIGEFSKNKINETIDKLVNLTPEEILLQEKYIKTIISLIGEPVIKNRLTEMLNESLSNVNFGQ